MPDIPRSETISTQQQDDSDARAASAGTELHVAQPLHRPGLVSRGLSAHAEGWCTGVDGQTAAAYADNLEANLRDLLDRAKSGRYRAPAVKRAYVPKGDGTSTRPIGVPTFEDKILQRAVAMVLEPIYEQDFLDCSYGFRPGRSAHQALEIWRASSCRWGWVGDRA